MSKRLTTEEFIERAKQIHGNKYDYSKVEYINSATKVCIICPIHGEFWQKPDNHIYSKMGCPKCKIDKLKNTIKLSTEEFIKRAKQIHGSKYDYSKVEYVNMKEQVCIVCPIHGEFWQRPEDHIFNKSGCPKCCNKLVYDTIFFINESKKIHGNKYDYSKVNYINAKTKVCIICPIHGEFWQTPDKHLKGQGCRKCSYIKRGDKKKLTTEEFIKRARKIHGDKYDYSKVEYVNNFTKVCIICPIHGEFWQKPANHLNLKQECPSCYNSKLETDVALFLSEKKILFEQEKRFEWLGKQRCDFYLPQYNIVIECQGIQHFKPISFSGKDDAKKTFKYIQELDKKKKELCEKHNIKVLYYSNLGIKYPYEVYEDINELLIDNEKKYKGE